MTSCAMRMPRTSSNGCAAEIDEQHLDLAAIVAVDRARRIEHGDAVLRGEPRARTHLRLEAVGQCHREAGRR